MEQFTRKAESINSIKINLEALEECEDRIYVFVCIHNVVEVYYYYITSICKIPDVNNNNIRHTLC